MKHFNLTETVTAQNSTTNQSNGKIFGTISEREIQAFATKDSWAQPAFIIDYLKRVDNIVSKLRCSDETKSFIKSGYGIILGYCKANARAEREWIANSCSPAYLSELTDEEEILAAATEEIGLIVSELINEIIPSNFDGFYDETIEDYKEHIDEYLDVLSEKGIEPSEDICEYLKEIN